MSVKDVTKKILKETEKAATRLTEGSTATQKTILAGINKTLRTLEVDASGNIKPTSVNIRLIRSLREDINKIVVNKAYLNKVGTYLNSFGKVKGITDGFFKGVADNFNPNKNIFKDILSLNIDLTKNSLTKTGIDQNVIQPVLDLVSKSITSGGFVTDLEDDLRLHILGDSQRLGSLEGYTSQITRDALNQYSRNYNQSVSTNLNLEWYFYSGSIIQDTRSYCVLRAGKYFHKKEVENVPSQWPGRIPGTNSSSIFVNAGGFNCRHIYMPVLIAVVPKSTIQRNIANGNFSS